MDIEGGSQTGFTAFLTTLRQLMNGGSKRSVFLSFWTSLYSSPAFFKILHYCR